MPAVVPRWLFAIGIFKEHTLLLVNIVDSDQTAHMRILTGSILVGYKVVFY